MRKTVCFPVRIWATGKKTNDWGPKYDKDPDLYHMRYTEEFLMQWFGGNRRMMFPLRHVGFFTMQMRA